MKKMPYVIACFFFLIDFISKQIVTHVMAINESLKIIPNFFYLTYVKNTGAAWSILEDERILLLIITVILLFLFNKYMNKEKLEKIDTIVYGMIIGGILGNFFDRLVFSGVTDFLDFKIFGYNYPVFNLADTFIVVGIILLIIINLRKEHYGKNSSR